MTNQAMTERDKKLLYMLGFIIIIFMFVIVADRPLFRKIRATNEEIEKEQATHDEIEMKLSRMDLVKSYKEQIDSKVQVYAERYYPIMDSTQIDDLLTGYVLSEGLKAVDMYINIPDETVVLKPYKYSEAAKKLESEEESQESANTGNPDQDQVDAFTSSLNDSGQVDVDESADKVVDTSLSGVYAVDVSLKAFGSESRLKGLVDKLMKDQSLRVVSYQWQEAPGAGFSYVDGQVVEMTEADRSISIDIQLYMYDEDAYVEQMPAEEESETKE